MPQFLSNLRARGGITIPVTATPATPASGEVAVYVKSDGLVYKKDSAGQETLLYADSVSDPTIGFIYETSSSVIPPGFLLADGSAVSRTAYAELFARIGTTYGAGDGSTTFNLPNRKGRVGIGRDTGQTEFDTLGETGGAKTQDFTHDHQKNASGQSLSNVANVAGSYVVSTGNYVSKSDLGTQTLTTKSVMNPYIVLNYIVKVSSTVGGMFPNQIVQMSATAHTAANGWSKAPLAQANARNGSNLTFTANGVTVNESGWYRMDATVMWDGGTAGRRIARIVGAAASGTAASGGPTYASEDFVVTTAWYPGGSQGVTRYVTAGTHIRLELYQDTGATLSNIQSSMTVEALTQSSLDVYETDWTDVTFLGSWTNFETGANARKCQVKRVGKEVKYRGIMKGGSIGGGGVCFSVPQQFWPEYRNYSSQYWPCISNLGTGSSLGALAMGGTQGQFECVLGSNVWVDISGLHYFIAGS